MIETKRLIMREWHTGDLAPFVRLNADPVAMRHFPGLMTEAQTRTLIEDLNAHIAKEGYGGFAIAHRSDGQFLGMCGCKAITFAHGLPTPVEVGWRLSPAFWGQGYASEAARAALAHCFQVTSLSHIAAFTVSANKPSWSVMERLGMVRRADLDFDHPRVPIGHPLRAHIVYLADRASFM